MSKKIRGKAFEKECKRILVAILVCVVLITSVLSANPSLSKYMLDMALYDITLNSADSFEDEYIPLTNVIPTYNGDTLPPGGDPVPTHIGVTVAVNDPITDTTYYVVVKNNSIIWRNEDGTLSANNPNTFLQINNTRLNWYSDVSHPNYSSWNSFYENNNWTQGYVLIWNFGNTDQTRTFVWDHSPKKKDQPPYGKWVEIN